MSTQEPNNRAYLFWCRGESQQMGTDEKETFVFNFSLMKV